MGDVQPGVIVEIISPEIKPENPVMSIRDCEENPPAQTSEWFNSEHLIEL
jgi:hypothetical protein